MALFIVLFILTLGGCATTKSDLSSAPFSVLGSGASYYLVVPVKANRDLLDRYASKQKDSASLSLILDRTQMVYAGLYSDTSFSKRLLATGSFPKAASAIIFSDSKGWEKKSKKNIGFWYHRENIDAVIPKNGLVCISTADDGMETILGNFASPEPVQISPSFDMYTAHASSESRIGLYVSDAASLVGLVLGPEITLPIVYTEIYADPMLDSLDPTQTVYVLSARIVLNDVRTARAMMTLLRLALQTDVRLEGSSVYMDSYSVSAEKLAEFASCLYF